MTVKIPCYAGIVIGGPLDGTMYAEVRDRFTHWQPDPVGDVSVAKYVHNASRDCKLFHYRFGFIAVGVENDPITFWHLEDMPVHEAISKVFMYYLEGDHSDGA